MAANSEAAYLWVSKNLLFFPFENAAVYEHPKM